VLLWVRVRDRRQETKALALLAACGGAHAHLNARAPT
jgi:hypothetical protein